MRELFYSISPCNMSISFLPPILSPTSQSTIFTSSHLCLSSSSSSSPISSLLSPLCLFFYPSILSSQSFSTLITYLCPTFPISSLSLLHCCSYFLFPQQSILTPISCLLPSPFLTSTPSSRAGRGVAPSVTVAYLTVTSSLSPFVVSLFLSSSTIYSSTLYLLFLFFYISYTVSPAALPDVLALRHHIGCPRASSSPLCTLHSCLCSSLLCTTFFHLSPISSLTLSSSYPVQSVVDH